MQEVICHAIFKTSRKTYSDESMLKKQEQFQLLEGLECFLYKNEKTVSYDLVFGIDFLLESGGTSADEALQQIDDKKYTEKYILLAEGKGQIFHKLGINFCYNKEICNISDWREKVLEEALEKDFE